MSADRLRLEKLRKAVQRDVRGDHPDGLAVALQPPRDGDAELAVAGENIAVGEDPVRLSDGRLVERPDARIVRNGSDRVASHELSPLLDILIDVDPVGSGSDHVSEDEAASFRDGESVGSPDFVGWIEALDLHKISVFGDANVGAVDLGIEK